MNDVWTFTNVDSNGAVTGVDPSLGFKGSRPRVSYYNQTDGQLQWATFNGTNWLLAPLDHANDVGQYPSLAFGSSGNQYISYWDKTKKDIRWARPG